MIYKQNLLTTRRYITINNAMTNGFCELNEQEMMETDGGIQDIFDFF